MIKSLDISMYEDGYDVAQVDCLHNPVAAATGYFSRVYYFYYCILHGLSCIMEGYDTYTFHHQVNMILKNMGLKLNVIKISNDSDSNLDLIKKCISDDMPIILITKYNALFYNAYYHNHEFKSNHGVVVNAINTENATVAIKETTLLRDTGLIQGNTDVHYSLQITYSMLSDIIRDSNTQFILEGSQFQNEMYCIENSENCENVFLNILKVARLWGEDGRDELIQYIVNDNLKYKFLSDYKYLRMRFYGSMAALFSALKKVLIINSISVDELDKMEKKCLSNRNQVISVLYMNAKRGENLSDEEKEFYCNAIKKDVKILSLYLKNKIDEYAGDEYETEFVDISALCNNKAFEKEMSNKSNADITGEGTHFLEEKIKRGVKWEKGNFSFFLYSQMYDNMSCEGQIVKMHTQNNIYKINFLMCSEYGSYIEKCIIKYESGLEYTIDLMASDFYQPAIYEEFLFWSGVALNRKNGCTTKHSFPARLFAKSYNIPAGKVVEIKLPKRKNMHIFAISLEYKKPYQGT